MCASESPAHNLISAEVPNKLTNSAAATVIAGPVAIADPEPGDGCRHQVEADDHRPAPTTRGPGREEPSHPSADSESRLVGRPHHVGDVLGRSNVGQGGTEYGVQDPETGQRPEGHPREAVSTVAISSVPWTFCDLIVHPNHTTTTHNGKPGSCTPDRPEQSV